jgi:Asp-tRNA(Asn)/Glu-tRNA(Gln) amidotransferase A subunit family amidase
MRAPAGAQGLFGNRPSTGVVPMDGAIPVTTGLDAAGVFARSADMWATVAHAWYENLDGDYHSYPDTLWCPKDMFTPELINNGDASALVEKFMTQLEEFLGTSRIPVDLDDSWSDTHPPGTPSTLMDLLNIVRI